MRLILMLGFMAVTACATASGIRDKAPYVTAQAIGSHDAVVGCIAAKWGDAGLNLRTEKISDRTSVILSGSTMVGSDIVADVYRDGRVFMFKRAAAWGSLDDRLAGDLKSCL